MQCSYSYSHSPIFYSVPVGDRAWVTPPQRLTYSPHWIGLLRYNPSTFLPILTIIQHRRMANTCTGYENSCTWCSADEGKFLIAATSVPHLALPLNCCKVRIEKELPCPLPQAEHLPAFSSFFYFSSVLIRMIEEPSHIKQLSLIPGVK